MIRRAMWTATLVILLATAGPAAAKDVCVNSSSVPITYFFRGVKIPKAGKLAPISGVAAVNFPRVKPGLIQGTVYGQSDGLLRVDALVQGLFPQGFAADHLFVSASVDRKTFAGSDTTVLPNETASSGTWTTVDCKTLTIP